MNMLKKYDAIVVGGGHNGLTSAAYLAKAGKKVLVLERRHVLGGAAVSEEVFPGFRFSVCSYVVSLFRPHIIRELELTKYGFELIPLETSFTPLPNGDSLTRWSDYHRSREEIARFSQKDADNYPEFGLAMGKMGLFFKNIIDNPPPDPSSLKIKDLIQLLRMGKHFKESGSDVNCLHAQLLSMSSVEFLDNWFESSVLKSPMSVSGIIGTNLGVRSPGTAYVLLHHYMGEIDGAFRSWGFSKGGTGGISLAIAKAAQSYGAEIQAGAAVEKILIKNGKAYGVVLANGDEILSNVILSNADPRRTFFQFVGKENLPEEFNHQIENYKYRGSSGKVNLALDYLPEWSSRKGVEHLKGDIAIAPSIEYLEKAYDDSKYGRYSRRPYLNIVIPSLVDPSVAPPGKHVMSIFVQYAPYHLEGGASQWENQRESFYENVIDTIQDYCPKIRDAILHRQVLTPWDLEKEFGLTEGNIFHGELSLDQLLFLRPVSQWARYKTPIQGLWLCGSGAHPGGGIMGSPGELSAKTLLRSGELL